MRRSPHSSSRTSSTSWCAAIRFISAEPLLGPLDGLDLTDIDWLISGGESAKHRPVRIEWLRELRDRCHDEGVAYFFKQWGGRRPKAGGRELDGLTFDELPRSPRDATRKSRDGAIEGATLIASPVCVHS